MSHDTPVDTLTGTTEVERIAYSRGWEDAELEPAPLDTEVEIVGDGSGEALPPCRLPTAMTPPKPWTRLLAWLIFQDRIPLRVRYWLFYVELWVLNRGWA